MSQSPAQGARPGSGSMRVNVVCYEDPDAWILGSLAKALCRQLAELGCDARISRAVDPDADINHHIISDGFRGQVGSTDSMMVTHIDTEAKVHLLKGQLERAHMGVCTSRDTREKLIALGLPAHKLCFINYPSPQLGHILPRRTNIGVASRVYSHGSKREYMLAELGKTLKRDAFVFHIMGAGWEPVIAELELQGIEVRYYPQFDVPTYRTWWQGLDYYLYLGQDEGSTGLLDALEAGVPLIATPQGFHLDLGDVVEYPFQDQADLEGVFRQLMAKQVHLRNAVRNINWPVFASRHLAIWQLLLNSYRGAKYALDQDELAEAGIDAQGVEVVGAVSPWLGKMPQASGPGGAAHRPRVLMLAEMPVSETLRQLEPVLAASPRGLNILAAALGETLDLEQYRGPGLELRIVDRRDHDTLSLTRYAMDFDAVCHWNLVDPALCRAMNRREKPNYLFRNRVLTELARADGEAPRFVRDALSRGVRHLTRRRTARQLCVVTQVTQGSDLLELQEVCKHVNAVVVSSSSVDRALTGSGGRVVYAPELAMVANLDGAMPASTASPSSGFGDVDTQTAPLSSPASSPMSERRGVLFHTLFEVLHEQEQEEATAAAAWVRQAETAARYLGRAFGMRSNNSA